MTRILKAAGVVPGAPWSWSAAVARAFSQTSASHSAAPAAQVAYESVKSPLAPANAERESLR